MEAIAAFKTAINFKNDHVGAWMNHALLLEKSGKVCRHNAMAIPFVQTYFKVLCNGLSQDTAQTHGDI